MFTCNLNRKQKRWWITHCLGRCITICGIHVEFHQNRGCRRRKVKLLSQFLRMFFSNKHRFIVLLDYQKKTLNFAVFSSEVSPAKYPLQQKGPFEESLRLEMKKIQVMFEVENLDFHVPRLCIKSSVYADIKDWSKQVCKICYFLFPSRFEAVVIVTLCHIL